MKKAFLIFLLLAGAAVSVTGAPRLRVAFVGDPQVDSPDELRQARASVYSELRSRRDLDLVVILGDLVNNRMDLLAPSKASLDSLPCPWVCAPGNHDKDLYPKEEKRPRDLASFRRVLGYTDTTFVSGGIRFISMDNVRTEHIAGYDGALREPQREWLDSLVRVCRDEKVVFCTHIPLSWCADRDTLAKILSPCRDLLLVAGHTHAVRRAPSEFLPGVEELVAGAACGMFWRGLPDEHGVRYALMNCGAPRGYFVADFRPSKRQWYGFSYKAVGRPDDERCSVSLRDSMLLVNVYGGSTEGTVEVRMDGKWHALTPSKATVPEVQEVIDWNRSKDREYRRAFKYDFIPMRSMPSPHLWEIPLSKDFAKSRIRVRYSDRAMSFSSEETIR